MGPPMRNAHAYEYISYQEPGVGCRCARSLSKVETSLMTTIVTPTLSVNRLLYAARASDGTSGIGHITDLGTVDDLDLSGQTHS